MMTIEDQKKLLEFWREKASDLVEKELGLKKLGIKLIWKDITTQDEKVINSVCSKDT